MGRPPGDVQIWDKWNSTYRIGRLDEPSKVRLHKILAMMTELGIHDAQIMEVGCGTGWLSNGLSQFGQVTACDLGAEIIEYAQKTYPHVKFYSGDIHTLNLPTNYFDVVVTSEVLSHVPDQPAFLRRIADLLKPGGLLLITTQNKFVFERTAGIAPPDGWIRKWVTMKTLKSYLRAHFHIRSATTLQPEGHLGVLRVVNSVTINHYCSTAFGAERVKRFKEKAGFGQSIFIVAEKR